MSALDYLLIAVLEELLENAPSGQENSEPEAVAPIVITPFQCIDPMQGSRGTSTPSATVSVPDEGSRNYTPPILGGASEWAAETNVIIIKPQPLYMEDDTPKQSNGPVEAPLAFASPQGADEPMNIAGKYKCQGA